LVEKTAWPAMNAGLVSGTPDSYLADQHAVAEIIGDLTVVGADEGHRIRQRPRGRQAKRDARRHSSRRLSSSIILCAGKR
jgi:hypothetical protein